MTNKKLIQIMKWIAKGRHKGIENPQPLEGISEAIKRELGIESPSEEAMKKIPSVKKMYEAYVKEYNKGIEEAKK